ncbi:MAG: riboflavin biosynthesis protein RibF [Alphaproteobacteria bacterium]|nr:riboflavin biosynthesis protein RibF [Alphaproteobacteria bacterium]
MLLHRQSRLLARALPRAVFAVGNFDGLHRGHRAAIDYARGVAREAGRALVLLTFEPHPRRGFAPGGLPFRLTPFGEKVYVARRLGVDGVLALRFSRRFADIGAEEFARENLKGELDPAAVIIGENFRFGRDRAGDAEVLRGAGLDVRVFPSLCEGGEVISASLVRERLLDGQPGAAAELLGREFHIAGHIRRGDGRGARELGCPTANIDLHPWLIRPAFGIYAVRLAFGDDSERWFGGVASLGVNPMFPLEEPRLEVHLFGRWGDLVGRGVRVFLVKKIRDEGKFDSVHALKEQIQHDISVAKSILN